MQGRQLFLEKYTNLWLGAERSPLSFHVPGCRSKDKDPKTNTVMLCETGNSAEVIWTPRFIVALSGCAREPASSCLTIEGLWRLCSAQLKFSESSLDLSPRPIQVRTQNDVSHVLSFGKNRSNIPAEKECGTRRSSSRASDSRIMAGMDSSSSLSPPSLS